MNFYIDNFQGHTQQDFFPTFKNIVTFVTPVKYLHLTEMN